MFATFPISGENKQACGMASNSRLGIAETLLALARTGGTVKSNFAKLAHTFCCALSHDININPYASEPVLLEQLV